MSGGTLYDWTKPINPYRSGIFSGGQSPCDTALVCPVLVVPVTSEDIVGECTKCGATVRVHDVERWRNYGTALICPVCAEKEVGSIVELESNTQELDLAALLREDRTYDQLGHSMNGSESPWPTIYFCTSTLLRNPNSRRVDWESPYLQVRDTHERTDWSDAWYPVLLCMDPEGETDAMSDLIDICKRYPLFEEAHEHLVALLIVRDHTDALSFALKSAQQFPSNKVLANFVSHAKSRGN